MSGDGLRRRVVRSLPPLTRRDARIAELEEQLRRARASSSDAPSAPGPDDERGAGPETWEPPRGDRARALVRASGLLDENWYAAEVASTTAAPSPDDPSTADWVDHYLRHGAAAGLSPHPAFLGSWYTAQVEQDPGYGSLSRIRRNPLLHHLERGARRGLSPHPAFDAAAHLAEHPDAAEHPGGPLGHLLAGEGTAVPIAVPDALVRGPEPRRDRAAFLAICRAVGETLRASRGHGHLKRESPDFDLEAEARLKVELLAAPLDERPVVSVVVPTKDRVAVLGATLDSVLAQTWTDVELVVVDDGSTDGTADLLATYDDPRLVVLRHEEARGVSAARNTGLDAATGRFVAYLDSDNTWHSDFLELMVRFMLRDGHRAAYAMSELVESGGRQRRKYRGMPFSREALRERNYIDCIVLVHERSLLDETGGFDETLRRTVDWDLFLRLADATDLGFLPVLATTYDVWDGGGDRISTQVSVGYRHKVQQRTLLDFDHARTEVAARTAGRTSLVVVARTSAALTLDTVRRGFATAGGTDLEVVVVDDRLPEPEASLLLTGLADEPRASVHRTSVELTLEVARNLGAVRAGGDTLVFLPAGTWCEPGWLPPLRQALDDHAAVQPVVLHRDGTVWSAGAYVGPRGRARMLYRGLPGDAPEVRGVREVDAASAAALAVRAEVFVDVGGFDPLGTDGLSSGELSLRASTATGRPVAATGDSRVAFLTAPHADLRPWARRRHRSGDDLVDDAMGGRASGLAERLAADGTRLLSVGTGATDDPDGTPLVVHDRAERPLRFSIKIGAADVPDRETWGDWHFAVALADSLERLGHHAVVDCVEAWYRSSAHLDDVTLALRGLSYVDPSPDHVNLLWVISHSDRVTTPELLGYDAVFGASDRWCRQVSRRLPRPARTLLQCTDQRRFHPVPVDPERAHDVLAVANARNAGVRPSVAAVLEAGIVPDVYGTRWEGVLPPGAWKGLYVPNEELVSHYVSSTVVLNDHHEDMRVAGLLSNRLFDLAACEARVLSDHLPEVAEVFGDVVATWTDPSQVAALVERHRHETPEAAEGRRALGAHVREHHTFDARAAELAATALELRRARGGR